MKSGPCQLLQPHVNPLSLHSLLAFIQSLNFYILKAHQTPALRQKPNTEQRTKHRTLALLAGTAPLCLHPPPPALTSGLLQPWLDASFSWKPSEVSRSACPTLYPASSITCLSCKQWFNFSCFCVIDVTARLFQKMMMSVCIYAGY